MVTNDKQGQLERVTMHRKALKVDGRAIRRGMALTSFYTRLEHLTPQLVEHLRRASGASQGDLRGLLDALIDMLSSQNVDLRRSAASSIAVFKEDLHRWNDRDELDLAAVSALIRALADPDSGVRLEAAQALCRFAKTGSTDTVNVLSVGLDDQNAEVRAACMDTLQTCAGTIPVAVADALIRLIQAPGMQDPALVVRAVETLRDCGPDAASEAVDALAALLGDSRRPLAIRLAVCETLEWLGADARSAAEALLDVVLHRDDENSEELRVAAARALIHTTDLPTEIAGRPLSQDHRRGLLAILRQLGEAGRDVRRRLAAEWRKIGPIASPGPPTASESAAAVSGDASPDRLATLEAGIAEIKKLVKGQQAGQEERMSFSIKEVAELTGFSEWTLRQACKKRRLEAEKSPDGKWRISRGQLRAIQDRGLPK